jgi:hypothetical protein
MVASQSLYKLPATDVCNPSNHLSLLDNQFLLLILQNLHQHLEQHKETGHIFQNKN